MTRRGFLMLGVILLFSTVALATGSRELYLPVICFGLLLICSALSAYLGALSLACTGTLSRLHVRRGGTVNFTVVLRGFLLLPVTGELTVAPPGADRAGRKSWTSHVLFLRPGSHREQFTFPLECLHRGVFRVGMEEFRIHDIFGFFSFPLFQLNSKAASPYALSVHPVAYPLESEVESRSSESGATTEQVLDADSGDALAATREYRYGDPFKRIHWKQTARARKIFIRRYEPEENPQVLILVDAAALGDPIDYADLASDLTVTLAKFYLQQGCHAALTFVRLRHPDYPEEFRRTLSTENDFSQLDGLLLTLPFRTTGRPLDLTLSDYLQGSRANLVHIVTAGVSDRMLDAVKALRADGLSISCILPGEKPEAAADNPALRYVDDPQNIPAALGGRL